jgi:lipopolysaccharide export system permease protein
MTRLDKYISKQFLNTLLFAIVSFALITIVVDLVEYLDKFIDRQVPKIIIFQYYVYYLPYIIVLILPIAVLLASLFSLGQMARYNELTAMQTSGISLYRIGLPLFVLGFFLSIFMLLFAEYVLPPASARKMAIKRQYLDRVPQQIFSRQSNINVLQGEFERTYISFFDAKRQTAHEVMVQFYTDGGLRKRIDARRMVWADGKWYLEEGLVREFHNDSVSVQPFHRLELKNFPFQPEDLQKAQKQPDEMNFRELRQFIRQIVRNGADPQKWLVDLHLKIAFPFSNFIIILFGIPLASIQKRSGRALGFALSLIVCFFFFGLIKTFQALGYNGLIHPALAAWSSNLLIGGVGLFLLIRARK